MCSKSACIVARTIEFIREKILCFHFNPQKSLRTFLWALKDLVTLDLLMPCPVCFFKHCNKNFAEKFVGNLNFIPIVYHLFLLGLFVLRVKLKKLAQKFPKPILNLDQLEAKLGLLFQIKVKSFQIGVIYSRKRLN